MNYRDYRELQLEWRKRFRGKRLMTGLNPREITTKRLWVRIRKAIHDEWDRGERDPMKIAHTVRKGIAGLSWQGDRLSKQRVIEVGCLMICNANLTADQREEIVRKYDAGYSAKGIAQRFDVPVRYVCVLAWGARAHSARPRKIDALLAHRIRRRWRAGESAAALARHYKLAVMTVYQVLENKTHHDPNWKYERPRMKYRVAVEASKLLAIGLLPDEVFTRLRKKGRQFRGLKRVDIAAVAYGEMWPALRKWHKDAVSKWEHR